MTIHLTYCEQCASFFPDIKRTITQLQREFSSELRVVKVPCMAACDEPPVVMVEYDFLSRIKPDELDRIVRSHIELQRNAEQNAAHEV